MTAQRNPPIAGGKKLPSPGWYRQPNLLRRMFADPTPVLDELTGELGGVFGFGAGPVRIAVVGDSTILPEMFAMPSEMFRWGHKFNVLGFVVGPQSMIVSDGEEHHRQRSAVQRAFSRRRLNGWIPMIVDRTDAAIANTVGSEAKPSTVDLYPMGRNLVLEIAVRSLFGERLAAKAQEIGELFERPQAYLEAPAFKQAPHPFPRTARARVREDRRALDAIIDEQIAHLRANPSDDPLDVLADLVNARVLNDDEISDQVVTLIGAGYNTTAASLAWMIWRVSLTPGLWGRLRDEADRVFGPLSDRAARANEHTLAQLNLANRVMRETTRLHPAGVISPREASHDVIIGGYRIPKGTLILWSAHLAGRDPEAWADPLTFDPDRFVDPTNSQQILANLAWVPFGRGARNCIGFALAQMELTLIISRLAQRLDISTQLQHPPEPVGMVVNRPTGGATMTVAPRQHASD